MTVTLVCTVRNCGETLASEGRTLRCAKGHAFDRAKSGYVNLLQPQDRKSPAAGDSKVSVAARARFLERFGDPFVTAYASLSAGAEAILDVGCGVGFHLDLLRRLANASEAHGVDLAVPAVERAARRYVECVFVVANADRALPYADGSFDAIFSITSRRNPAEFARVLRAGGVAIVAVPAADDLAELREAMHGDAVQRERLDKVVDEHSVAFEVITTASLRHRLDLDRSAIDDLLASAYRGVRSSEQQRLQAIDRLEVTMSRDVVALRRR